MTNGQRTVLIATMAAGVSVLLILVLTAASVASCHADFAAGRGGLELCDLGWFMGAAVCILIGVVWLIVVAIVAIAGLVHRRRDR